MLAAVVRDHLDGVSFAHELAEEAAFAVLDVLEDRLLLFRVPAYDVHEARLVAQLAAYAFFRIEFYAVPGIYHVISPFDPSK